MLLSGTVSVCTEITANPNPTAVLKRLETARKDKVIGHSLDACVDLYVSSDILEKIQAYQEELRSICIVSSLKIHNNEETPKEALASEVLKGLAVSVFPAKGEKCERCWIVDESVGEDKEHPAFCSRCVKNVT